MSNLDEVNMEMPHDLTHAMKLAAFILEHKHSCMSMFWSVCEIVHLGTPND